MDKKQWYEVEMVSHFNRRENWGDPYEVSAYLILAGLVPLREAAGSPIHINNAYATEGHSENSLHYLGLAVDGHIKILTLIEQARLLLRVGFHGIGIYPHWSTKGFHADFRGLIGKENVYWIRDEWGAYHYYSDSNEWLKAVESYGG